MSLEAVPDYHSFVAPDAEMSLHIIEREARAGRYNSRAEFRADAAKIAAAAAAYNTAGTCRFEREPYIRLSQQETSPLCAAEPACNSCHPAALCLHLRCMLIVRQGSCSSGFRPT